MFRLVATAVAILAAFSAVCAINFPKGIDPMFASWANSFQKDGVSSNPFGGATTQVLVNTINGTIRGQTALTIGGHTSYNYLGIPYAKAPVGDLRFQPPQPYEGWGDDIWNATTYPKSCPQFLTNLTKADEDCLYLSVHSRRPGGGVGTGPLLPVVLFIHGGGFAFGQNSYYDASKLLEAEIVLVTTQYRLGPHGFFYTGDNTVSGNNGMKDMVQSLRWIKENIQAFGGDPNQVTVMGESAGAISSLYMLISPIAHGLFHKVLAMSGPPIMDFGLDRNPQDSARRLGEAMNCTWESNAELVACLKDADAIELAQGGLGLLMEDFKSFKMLLSGASPVVEGDVPGAFLPDDPVKLFREGAIADVPVLMGTVNHEGILPLAAAHFLVLNPEGRLNDSTYIREQLFSDMLTTWNIDETNNGAPITQALSSGYIPPGVDRGNFTAIQYPLLDMTTVIFMKAALLRTAELITPRLTSPVYMYNFEYYSQTEINSLYHLAFTVIPIIIGGEKPDIKPGICHADDLMYMFRLPFVLGAQDTRFSRKYVELFTNFMVHGNPTPEPSEDYPEWPNYTLEDQHYMRLDLPFEVKQDFTNAFKPGMKGVE